MLLSDNGSGVLLSSLLLVHAPNRTRAGLCFKRFSSDNPIWVYVCDEPFKGISLNGHTAHIFFRQGVRANDYENDYLIVLIIILVRFSITVVSFVSF